MIIQCDKCFTRFRIDDSKVTGTGVKVRCTKCQNVFIATPPAPQQDAPQENAETTEPPVKTTPPEEKPEEKKDAGMGFDQQEHAPDASGGLGADMGGAGFLSDSSNEGADSEKPAEDDSGRFQVDTTSNFDLSGCADMGGEENAAESQQMSVGKEFNFDDAASGPPAAEQNNKPKESKDTGGWKLPPEEKTSAAAPPPVTPKRESVVSFSAPAPGKAPAPSAVKKEAAPTEGVQPPAEKKDTAAKQAGGFNDSAFDRTADELESLVKNLPGEENPLGQDTEEDEDAGVKTAGHTGGGNGLAAGIIIFVALAIIGAALYFTGVFTPAQRQAAQKTIDITGVTVSFVDNKNAGRLLVLKAQIINVTNLPQTVRGVKGTVYGSKNEQLSAIVVSAGRTLGAEDLKNMPKEDILKSFKDLSSSVIPAKGSAPVMIVFTAVPQGMADAGIEIVR